MFQSFESASHKFGAERLEALRARLAAEGLDGFIVPRADRHQGEYVPERDERLRWLTGFTGSAGQCVVLEDRAALFVDGRYTLQAAEQAPTSAFEVVEAPPARPSAWLAENAPENARIGIDPWLLTASQLEAFQTAGKARNLQWVPINNPIDAVWENQPGPPSGAIRIHPLELAGTPSSEKRALVAKALREQALDRYVLTLPDSVAWLLNIRGSDLSHTPVALAFAMIDAAGEVELFIEGERADAQVLVHLGDGVRLRDPAELLASMATLSAQRVGLDRSNAPVMLASLVSQGGGEVVWQADPCIALKARKSSAEAEGARAAQLRDGAAMVRFLCWLDAEAPSGAVDEIEAAQKLESFRAETGKLEDISFDTISAAGPHAALPHYRVNRESNATLEPGNLYLVDSGGQYKDGTTDITRTVAVGEVSADARRAFTLVLKGMIAVSVARFPVGTTGVQIDAFARAALWQAGFDFDHGTGHGVGSFLGVHEGPASLSRRGTVALEPGMILSNEPGYYRKGAFGIRIENLVLVREAEIPDGGERPMLSFETLTLCPIDLRMIAPELLDSAERQWLEAYHARVYEALYPLLPQAEQEWLEQATTWAQG